jgi:head-tail adaptor
MPNCQVTIEQKSVTQDPVFGTPIVTWVPLVGSGSPVVAERFHAEVQDALPSRSEAVTQGLAVARNQTRLRMRWRDDIDSSMRVTVHKDSGVIYQIVGGPADIGGRKEHIEMVLERFSS